MSEEDKETIRISLDIGDCKEVLRNEYEEDSIDAVVTDPPYGLGDEPDPMDLLKGWIHEGDHAGSGSGFMGRCLHPDTELLTQQGWKSVGDITDRNQVKSLDPKTHEVEFSPVNKTFTYDYDDDLVVIEGSTSKQVVTPNHRLFVKTENGWEFCEAQDLPSHFKVKTPSGEEKLSVESDVQTSLHHKGEVHCCELEKNHIFLARIDGKKVWTGNSWDAMVPGPGTFEEIKRVLKPGSKAAVFSGTRTLHLMIGSLRFAGFEIEDVLSWTYGSGFPKSHNVRKHMAKKLAKDDRYGDEGEKRCECVDEDYELGDDPFDPDGDPDPDREKPRRLIVDDYGDNDLVTRVCSWCLMPDQKFIDSTEGKGTALKPAWEGVIVAKKPEESKNVDPVDILEWYGFSDKEIDEIMNPEGLE